jgi:serine/threonine protein kinase
LKKEQDDDQEIAMTMAGNGPNKLVNTFTKSNVTAATLDQFERLNLVGKGTFGKVFKVRHNQTGKIFAMKTIRKDTVL